MPRKPRSREIIDSEVGTYHVTSRCVQRAFLMGEDRETGICFHERRAWLHKRAKQLARFFLIDIIGFSIMANHLHLILRNRPDLVKRMSDEEAIRAWWEISPHYRRHGETGRLTPKRLKKLLNNADHIRQCRERLSSISWFMRYLKQPIAVQANAQQRRSGHFWEARFRVQVIDSMPKLANAMVYVDLNPIRAGLAKSLEDSEYTSAHDRIASIKRRRMLRTRKTHHARHELQKLDERSLLRDLTDEWLSPVQMKDDADTLSSVSSNAAFTHDESPSAPSSDRLRASDRGVLPIPITQYLALVDCVARRECSGKRGKIPPNVPPILRSFGIDDPNEWFRFYDNYAESQMATYSCKVNTDEESELVKLPFGDDRRSNQDALM